MGVDDLLLGLTHHWSRDTSIFPTEDDRLDLPALMLFQAYTACRPAELVDGTKSRGAQDLLLDDSDENLPANLGARSCLRYNKDRNIDNHGCKNIQRSRNIANVDFATRTISASANNKVAKGSSVRKHKALCYEDINLWVVKDPKHGGRDVLAMEVSFRYHKGADNKPKPLVSSLAQPK